MFSKSTTDSDLNKNSQEKALKTNDQYLPVKMKNGHTNFFYVYFLFSYYIGFIPFRFRFDFHHSTFTIHSWYPQKIICAVIHVTVLVRYALEIKKVHYDLKPSDPIAYFELIERSSSFLCKVIAFHSFWKKKNIFLKIINILETSSFPHYNPYKIQSTFFLSTICSFYIIVSIARLLFDPVVLNSYTLANNSNSWYRGLVIESRYSYLISTGEGQQTQNISVSFFDNTVAGLTAVNILFRIIAGFYLELGILMSVLSLWAPSVGYVNSLLASIETMRSSEFSVDKEGAVDENKIPERLVIQQFKQLKSVSTSICEAIGGFLIPAISEVAFGYAIDFEEMILTENAIRRFTDILFYTSTSSSLVFAAETCRKITCVKTWFCVNEKNLEISRNELMMILDNIAHDEICINAGGRVTINYSFMGTLVVVLVTFFIIRLQSELTSSTPF